MIACRRLARGAALALGLATGACGFHPLYAPGPGQKATLPAVYVDLIPDRPGQLLRQALQARLDGSGAAAAKRFTLSVSFSENRQFLGVQTDNSTTRNRDIGTASWSLRPLDNPGAQIASGSVRSVDGFNIIDEQYFYMDLSEEATQRRLAEALADQIVTSLSVYFAKHPA